MKYFINLIVLIICFGCSVSKNEVESEEAGFITPTVLNNYDTIKNGQVFKAKVFFENSYLFEEARKNRIKDYYSLTYETNVDGETVFIPFLTQTANVIDDTAYVEFIAKIDSLEKDQIEEYCWFFHAKINYKVDERSIDTTFASMNCIAIMGH